MSLGGDTVHHSLAGHSAPVLEETYVPDLAVTSGRIPAELSGIYLRNGGNPVLPPKPGEPFHFFQGTGMVHGVRLNPVTQRATYVKRWVRTPKFLTESETGEKDSDIGLDPRGGAANTALVFHAGKLLALEEAHLPMVLQVRPDGDIVTCDFEDFGGRLNHPFTAHPKLDRSTGELVFFGYNVLQKPYCTYGVVNRSGVLTTSVPIDYDKPVMIHDMAISAHWTVLLILPLTFDFKKVMAGDGGAPFKFEKSRPSRFALLPRHATSPDQIVWFEEPVACFGFHTSNAWEDEDGQTVHVVLNASTDVDLGFSKKYAPEDLQRMTKFSFHLPTKSVQRTTVVDRPSEFPSVNPMFVARPSRFNYSANIFDERVPRGEVPQFDAYVAQNGRDSLGALGADVPVGWSMSKIDVVDGCERSRIVFGDEKHAGEPVFVPKSGGTAEDAGYLIFFLHDAAANTSSFVVYDAETMSSEPVCTVALPTQVPLGFHSLWVSEAELEQQLGWQAAKLAPREPLYCSPAAKPLASRL